MNHSPTSKSVCLRYAPLAALVCLLLLPVATGCRSLTDPSSVTFAGVTIKNHTTEEITRVTVQVFAADGYRGGMNNSGQMVFEKEASRMTSLAREGAVNSYYGANTINRVRADIEPIGGGVYRLECKAYMVTGGSDPFFQDEVPMTNVRRGPYQSLLDKVAAQLK